MKALLCLLLLHILCAVVHGEGPAVLVYFSDNYCNKFEAQISFLGNVTHTLTGGKGGLTCAEAIQCLNTPSGVNCDPTRTVQVRASAIDVNTVAEDIDNIVEEYRFEECLGSGLYPHCSYYYLSAEKYSRAFEEGNTFSIPELAYVSEEMKNTAHLLYFDDDNCEANTFIAGASFTNKVEYRLTGANGPSCEESLICLVDPLSSACAAVQSGIRSLVTTENLSPSSVRATDDLDASIVVEDDCIQSRLYGGCSYTYKTQQSLAAKLDSWSDDNTAYILYYSDNDCKDFVSSRPFNNYPTTLVRGLGSTCSKQTRCLWDPESSQCRPSSFQPAEYLLALVNDTSLQVTETIVQGYIGEAPMDVEQRVYGDYNCQQSTYYDKCTYRYMSKFNYNILFNCTLLLEPDDDDDDHIFHEDTEMLEDDSAHLVYFTDEECSLYNEGGSIMVGNTDIQLTGGLGGDCLSSLECLINPDSIMCKDIQGPPAALLRVHVVNGTYTREFEGGNETLYSSQDCAPSSVYRGCYFRYIPNAMFIHTVTECSVGSLEPILFVTIITCVLVQVFRLRV